MISKISNFILDAESPNTDNPPTQQSILPRRSARKEA
jgi:hypothetical protein